MWLRGVHDRIGLTEGEATLVDADADEADRPAQLPEPAGV